MRLVFVIMIGMCFFGGDFGLEYGLLFVMRRLIINCRFVFYFIVLLSNSIVVELRGNIMFM